MKNATRQIPLRLDTKPGEKVVYAYPDNGYVADQLKLLKAGLVVGKTYTVKRLDVGSFSSTVLLEEFPGLLFNHVNFTNATPRPVKYAHQPLPNVSTSWLPATQARKMGLVVGDTILSVPQVSKGILSEFKMTLLFLGNTHTVWDVWCRPVPKRRFIYKGETANRDLSWREWVKLVEEES